MAAPELVPVRIGGHIVAYRPASEPKKTSAKSAAKKAADRPATTAEEATE